MRKKVFKEVHAKAKKVQICPFCKDLVGQIKKNGILKISYDRYRYKKPGAEAESKLCKHYLLIIINDLILMKLYFLTRCSK